MNQEDKREVAGPSEREVYPRLAPIQGPGLPSPRVNQPRRRPDDLKHSGMYVGNALRGNELHPIGPPRLRPEIRAHESKPSGTPPFPEPRGVRERAIDRFPRRREEARKAQGLDSKGPAREIPAKNCGHGWRLLVRLAFRVRERRSRSTVRKRVSQSSRTFSSHSAVPRRGAGSNALRRIRPSRCRRTSPALSKTLMCLEMVGGARSKGAESSPTLASPRASLDSMARRVGSERAKNVRLRRSTVSISPNGRPRAVLVKGRRQSWVSWVS